MEFKDDCRVIGVSREATGDEIQKAYRRLARKYHPDVSKEAGARRHYEAMAAELKDFDARRIAEAQAQRAP